MSDCTEIWILNYWLAIQILYSSPHWTQSSGYMGGVFVYTCRSSPSVWLIISHFHTVFSLFVEMTTIPVKTHNWSFTLNKDNWFFFLFSRIFQNFECLWCYTIKNGFFFHFQKSWYQHSFSYLYSWGVSWIRSPSEPLSSWQTIGTGISHMTVMWL